MEDRRTLIAEAWTSRTAQDQEGFLERLLRLRRLLPPSPEPTVADLTAADLAPADWAQIELLQVSLLRQKNAFVEADAILERVRRVLWSAHLPEPPRLFMERGLNALARSDYFHAFEDFSRCAQGTSENVEVTLHVQASLNALIAAEALGLPQAKAFAAFTKLLEGADPCIVDQWDALVLRRSFREGDLTTIATARARANTQGEYFREWFAHLPYQTVATPRAEAGERWLNGDRPLYLGSYRLRTLQGLSHPDDARVAKLSQKIGRLYLWTWYWLEDPARLPSAKLDALLVEIQADMQPHKVGVDEAQMLRNAIYWISLFHPGHAHEFRRFLGTIGFAGENATIYDLEYLIVTYLTARRGQDRIVVDDLERLIPAHPVFAKPGHRLGDLFALRGEGFVANVRRVLASYRVDRDADLIVDLTHHRLVTKRLSVASEAACRLLWLLRREGAVGPRDLMDFVFEIPDYDPGVHPRKINNLLARVRPLLPPGLTLRFRGGRVGAQGGWERVAWVGEHAFAARDHFRFRFDPGTPPAAKAPTDLATFGTAPFSRADLEKKLKKSRATVNRTLKEWLRRGLIRADGRARSTRYVAVQTGDRE